jgi:hypothetical protein
MSKLFPKDSKFPLGQLLLSPGAMECLSEWQIRQALAHHAEGNWGEYHEEQWALNDLYLKEGDGPLDSAHWTRDHLMFYISTNAARSLTKVFVGRENREREWNE